MLWQAFGGGKNVVRKANKRSRTAAKAKHKIRTGAAGADKDQTPNGKKWQPDDNPMVREKKVKYVLPSADEEQQLMRKYAEAQLVEIDKQMARLPRETKKPERRILSRQRKAWLSWMNQLQTDEARPAIRAQFLLDFQVSDIFGVSK